MRWIIVDNVVGERQKKMTKKPPVNIRRSGMTYTDKVVIVTGGSKGIGEGCARVFADAGSKVVICARGTESGNTLAAELSKKGPGSCHFVQCDVAEVAEVREMIDETVRLYGRLDCLINNAGYHPPHKRIDDFEVEEFRDLLDMNLVSYWAACKHALPHLRATQGSIINMSSLVGEMGQEGATTYCATKGAITAFSKALSIEEAVNGVRVNTVLPGNIFSDSRVQGLKFTSNPDYINNYYDVNQHCGRSGTNEEVGQLCLFLASDASSYISGAAINISFGAELGYGVKYPTVFLEGHAETEHNGDED